MFRSRNPKKELSKAREKEYDPWKKIPGRNVVHSEVVSLKMNFGCLSLT